MLDMALVLATFECPVSVILQNAGVFWASLPTMPDNSPLELSGKLKSLPLYDIDNVLIDENSCKERGIKVSDHFPGKLCKRDKILDRLNISDVVLEA